MLSGEHVMLSFVEVEPHSAGERHHHPEEQWGVLLEGSCVRVQDGMEVVVTAGDVWHTPGGVEHAVRNGEEPARLLDVFGPPRPAYREDGAGFDADRSS